MPNNRVVLFVLLACILSACGTPTVAQPAPTPSAVPPTASTAAPARTLRVFNWNTYIDPAILSDFEKQFGVTVQYTTFESDDNLLTAMHEHPDAYDLIVPSDYAVAQLRREALLAPLDKAALPNLVNLDPLFVNPAYDPGNRFCVPYQWGTTGIGYNRKQLGRDISGWADVFTPSNDQPITLIDGARETLGSILVYLGYSPNTTSSVEIAAARDFLIKHRIQISGYAPDDGQDQLAAGKTNIVLEYSGDMLQVMADHPDLQYVIPPEGAIIWSDNMCIPAKAANQELAEQFMNFILDPKVGAQLSNFIHYSSPNKAALPLINQQDRTNVTLYPSMDQRQHLFFMVDVGPEVAKLYDDTWEAVKAQASNQ